MGGICCTNWKTYLDLAFSPQTARLGMSITLSSTIARGWPNEVPFPPTICLDANAIRIRRTPQKRVVIQLLGFRRYRSSNSIGLRRMVKATRTRKKCLLSPPAYSHKPVCPMNDCWVQPERNLRPQDKSAAIADVVTVR